MLLASWWSVAPVKLGKASRHFWEPHGCRYKRTSQKCQVAWCFNPSNFTMKWWNQKLCRNVGRCSYRLNLQKSATCNSVDAPYHSWSPFSYLFFHERAEARYFIKRKESDQVLRSPKWSWHLRVLHGAERRPLSLRFNYTTTLSDLRDTKPAKTHTEISLATLEQTTDSCSDLPSKTRLLRSFQSDQQTRVTRESNPFRCAFGTCFRAASYQSASESTGKGARAAKPSGFRVLNQTSLLKTQPSRRPVVDGLHLQLLHAEGALRWLLKVVASPTLPSPAPILQG